MSDDIQQRLARLKARQAQRLHDEPQIIEQPIPQPGFEPELDTASTPMRETMFFDEQDWQNQRTPTSGRLNVVGGRPTSNLIEPQVTPPRPAPRNQRSAPHPTPPQFDTQFEEQIDQAVPDPGPTFGFAPQSSSSYEWPDPAATMPIADPAPTGAIMPSTNRSPTEPLTNPLAYPLPNSYPNPLANSLTKTPPPTPSARNSREAAQRSRKPGNKPKSLATQFNWSPTRSVITGLSVASFAAMIPAMGSIVAPDETSAEENATPNDSTAPSDGAGVAAPETEITVINQFALKSNPGDETTAASDGTTQGTTGETQTTAQSTTESSATSVSTASSDQDTPTPPPTTAAPTTAAPTTVAPTTASPTSEAPSTAAPTTEAPSSSEAPTTTQPPTTEAPTTTEKEKGPPTSKGS